MHESWKQIAAWRDALRRDGRRVAFTNGCFDLLHAGHVRLLVQARNEADALIVAINDDASVRELKGPSRPLVPADERAELLLALEAVDRVMLFSETNPLQAILAVEPDVLVKGADWAEDAIVGAAEVKGRGGRVVRVPLAEGLSTSAVVERIVERYGR